MDTPTLVILLLWFALAAIAVWPRVTAAYTRRLLRRRLYRVCRRQVTV